MTSKLGLSFDSSQAPAAPRHAATVIVLREVAEDLEVYAVVRNPRSGFLGGALVFPGGKLDEADLTLAATLGEPEPRALALSEHPAEARALCVAAARETLEEAGILAASADGDAARRAAALVRGGTPFGAALAEIGARIELSRFVAFARWVTPEAEPRRFDARFYLVELPPGQEPSADAHETTHGFWARPAAILEAFARGDHQLAPPTTRCLELLAGARTFTEARALAAAQPLLPVCPRFVPGDPPALALPGDPAHEIAEVRVAGPSRFVLRDGRFVSEEA